MTEDMNDISGRRPIHERNPQTPPRDEYDDGESVNESPEQYSGSGSDFDEFEGTREVFELSRSVPRTPQRPKRRPTSATRANYSYGLESNKHKDPPKNETTNNKSKSANIETTSSGIFNKLLYTFAILVIVSAIVGYTVFQQTDNKYVPLQKNCSYVELQKKYPQQDTWLWRSLKVGIESILNNRAETQAVFLLAHHGGEHVYQLVKDIGVHSSSCFGQKMSLVEMASQDFISSLTDSDYGYAIEKYRSKIKKGKVILIGNLNEIPAEAAKALHTICDTHSPIDKDVVIFLTLTIPPIEEGTNVESNVEDTLINLWGKNLEPNELDPLIARVTDQVIALKA